DPEAIANLADLRQVLRRRDQDAGADRLEDDRRDLVRPFELNQVLELLRALDPAAGVMLAERAAVAILLQGVNRPGDAEPGSQAAGRASRRERAVGRAVVGAAAGDDLGAPGDHARDLDRDLVGLAPADGEEALGEVTG